MNLKPTTITTASSTRTKNKAAWRSLRREVQGEIMKTDIACEVLFLPEEQAAAEAALDAVFARLRDFEARYSRFIEGNELWHFNRSTQTVVSPEFFRLLEESARYHVVTSGRFDPSILPILESEGYVGAASGVRPRTRRGFSELKLDPATLLVTKPRDLVVDFGGIGKGFIVDRIAEFLSARFEHFLIDAGGDLFVKGKNKKEGYDYWAIEIEHPDGVSASPALLMLTDMAVATSGINRRHWMKDGTPKHHIIDPALGQSATPDFLSASVIAPSVTAADVFAKTLFIAGREHALVLSESLGIPAFFVEPGRNPYANRYVQRFLWQAA